MRGFEGSVLLAIPGLKEPAVEEFLAHPDFRQIAAFFLGWAFIISTNYILYSSPFQTFFRRATGFLHQGFSTGSDEDVAARHDALSDKSSSVPRLPSTPKFSTLVFTLSLCFSFASAAHMSSLLTFDTLHGTTKCVFAVALGGFASQAARLVGVMSLIFELRQSAITHKECVVLWTAVLVEAGLAFASNLIGTGITKTITQLGTSVCYRKHYLPTSLALSMMYIIMEIYIILRLSFLFASHQSFHHWLAPLQDAKVLRTAALLLLEILTIVPGALWTNVLAEFIPFSIGVLAVLWAFKYECPISERISHLTPPVAPELPLNHVNTPSVLSPTSLARHTNPGRRSRTPASGSVRLSHHPFATSSDVTGDRPTPADESYQPPRMSYITRTARSSIDSVAAKSIKNAVVQVAVRVYREVMDLGRASENAEYISASQVLPVEYPVQVKLNRSAMRAPPTPPYLADGRYRPTKNGVRSSAATVKMHECEGGSNIPDAPSHARTSTKSTPPQSASRHSETSPRGQPYAGSYEVGKERQALGPTSSRQIMQRTLPEPPVTSISATTPQAHEWSSARSFMEPATPPPVLLRSSSLPRLPFKTIGKGKERSLSS